MPLFDLIKNDDKANNKFRLVEDEKQNRRLPMQILGICIISMLTLFAASPWQTPSSELSTNSHAIVAEPMQVSRLILAETGLDSHVRYGSVPLQTISGSLAVVGANGAEVFDAPDGRSVTNLIPGMLIDVNGRSADRQWAMIATSDGVTGWVEVDALLLFELDELPISDDATTAADSMMDSANDDQMMSGDDNSVAVPVVAPASISEPQSTVSTVAVVSPVPQARQVGAKRVLSMVRSNGTTLRSSPNGGTIQSLQAGATVNTLGRSADGGWLWGETKDGSRGWVSADRVLAFGQLDLPIVDASGRSTTAAGLAGFSQSAPRRPAPANPQNLPLATVATDGARLNIRSGPGVQYAIMGKAQRGEQFVVLGRNAGGDWIQIEVPDLGSAPGWISASYATIGR